MFVLPFIEKHFKSFSTSTTSVLCGNTVCSASKYIISRQYSCFAGMQIKHTCIYSITETYYRYYIFDTHGPDLIAWVFPRFGMIRYVFETLTSFFYYGFPPKTHSNVSLFKQSTWLVWLRFLLWPFSHVNPEKQCAISLGDIGYNAWHLETIVEKITNNCGNLKCLHSE